MSAFVPEPFAEPVVNPSTATLFRRTPYISPTEYGQAPTAISTSGLVPGGSAGEQKAALAAVIMRASDWVDTICFHKADGTLAASPSVESAWIRQKDNGELVVICNYKPILEVDSFALGPGPGSLQNIGQEAANGITIGVTTFRVYAGCGGMGPVPYFPSVPTRNGRVWCVWSYVNGFPHSFLAEDAEAEATSIVVGPSNPGGSKMFGVYPGTQLTIHDGANTEVIVVESVDGLTLNLSAPLLYAHAVPEAPDSVRVSSVPWLVEQACISLTSSLIKMRGSRAMVIPQAPAGAGASGKPQAVAQAGGKGDEEAARRMLQPFITTWVRST